MKTDPCTRNADCVATAHWWNCLKGKAIWRKDNFTTNTAAAEKHAELNQC